MLKKKSVYILVTDKYRYCRYIANIPMILNLVPRYVLGSNFFSRPERVKTLIKWRFSKYCLRAQRPPGHFLTSNIAYWADVGIRTRCASLRSKKLKFGIFSAYLPV